MIQLIRNLISLNRLTKAGAIRGQVATLLVLLMVILLVFVLATVNIGNMSVKATAVANAADSAALELGSSLVTEARMQWEGLGGFEKCQATGILTMIIAFVVAVIVTIVTWGAGAPSGWIMFAAIVGGTVAGAISGEFEGIGWEQGAIIGFQIGLAVGTIAVGFGAGAAPAAAGVGTTTAATVITVNWGEVALGSLALLSWVPRGINSYKYVTEAKEQLRKDLMKLDKYDRFRESAFFTAMSQLVDDPNWKRDQDDIDGDGDYYELVPEYFWWWHRRMLHYAEVREEQAGIIRQMLNTMRSFKDFLYCQYDAAGQGHCSTTPGPLERLDYKWVMDQNGVDTAVSGPGIDDGSIPFVLRSFWNIGPAYRAAIGMYGDCGDPASPVPMPMWAPGPSAAAMNIWTQTECCPKPVSECGGKPQCTCPPAGYDNVDDLGDTSRYWSNLMNAIISEDMAPYTWSSWMQFFYTENPTDGSYFNELGRNITMLQELRSRMLQARSLLPACDLGTYQGDPRVCGPFIPGQWGWYQCGEEWEWCYGELPGDCAHNFPCSLPAVPKATFDEPADDEMKPSIDAIDNLIAEMTNFKNALEAFNDSVRSRTVGSMTQYGGYNPVAFEWDDLRGHNVIMAQSGNYVMPLISEPRGNWRKKCVELENYSDGGNCWIKVTKSELSSNVGPLGRWNPFDPTARGISRTGKVTYTLGGDGTPVLRLRD